MGLVQRVQPVAPVLRGVSWLDTYLAYTQHLESPTLFHQWAALAACGHVLGRKVWMVRGGEYCIFPAQLMVVFVSPSAVVRKGTAIEAAVKLLDALPWGYANVLPAKTSPQQLVAELQRKDDEGVVIEDEDAVGLIVAEEMGAFFSSEGFLDSMATHVTALFNAKHGLIDPVTLVPADRVEHFKFRSWKVALRNPCVGLLGGTTPRGIADELPAQARTTGFMGRVLWVYASETDRPPNSLSDPHPPHRPSATTLVAELQRMGDMAGHCVLSKQGRARFDTWYYDEHAPFCRSLDVDLNKDSGYHGRKPDHVLRIAMTLSGMESDDRVVRQAHVETALRWLRPLERGIALAWGQVDTHRRASAGERLLGYLDGRQWVPWRQLLQRMWRTVGGKEEVQQLLDTFVSAGELELRGVGAEREWRRVVKRGRQLKRGRKPGE